MQWLGIHDLGTFVLAVLVFLAIPGPGTFALLTATAKGGVRAGYVALAGLALGDQVLMWLAVAGVAALLRANPLLFHALQYLGAAYLLWIGLQLLLRRGDNGQASPRMQSGNYFRQGLLITLLNPKAIMFYMAFFPLFIDPATHRGVLTFAAMAAIIVVLSLVYCSGLIFIGHGMSRRLQHHRQVRRWLHKGAGLFLVGFGLRLAVAS